MFNRDCARRGGFPTWRLYNIRKIHLSRTRPPPPLPPTPPPSGRSEGTTAQVAVWGTTTFSSLSLYINTKVRNVRNSLVISPERRRTAERHSCVQRRWGFFPLSCCYCSRMQLRSHAATKETDVRDRKLHTKTCHAHQTPHEYEAATLKIKIKTTHAVFTCIPHHLFSLILFPSLSICRISLLRLRRDHPVTLKSMCTMKVEACGHVNYMLSACVLTKVWWCGGLEKLLLLGALLQKYWRGSVRKPFI